MILISLDEHGGFEKNASNDALFIGGVMYDDCDNTGDLQTERKRLISYFREVCSKASACSGKPVSFPKDLHRGGSNKDREAAAKQVYTDAMMEFLTKGTFEGKPLEYEENGVVSVLPERLGEYYIFSMIKSRNGKDELLKNNISDIAKDDVASNLYIHMAHDLITKLVFHNPVVSNIKNVEVNLPTRVARLDIPDPLTTEVLQKMREYEAQGFEYREHQEEKKETIKYRIYYITNTSNYRTAIERELMNGENYDVQFNRISATSIKYEPTNDANILEERAFLYLSDAICSILAEETKKKIPQECIVRFKNKALDFSKENKHLIFGYDTVDAYFSKAWKKLEEKDYYKALSIAYDGMQIQSEFSKFYVYEWFPKLEEALKKETNISAFNVAIKKLNESVFNNNVQQEKLLYIYRNLEAMIDGMEYRSEEDKADLYYLYDAGIRTYTHLGRSDCAMELLDKCRQFVHVVGVEKYLRTLTSMVNSESDLFLFEQAYEHAKENVGYQEYLLDVRGKLFKEPSDKSVGYGRALSSFASMGAFLGKDIAEVEENFLAALNKMEKGAPNYYITMSFLLHAYIEYGQRDKYNEMAKEYFGGHDDLEEQLGYLIKVGAVEKNALIDMGYALYVYMKALYLFEINRITPSLMTKLSDINEYIGQFGKEASNKINSHPWEIVYKYLAFIMLKKGDKEKAKKYMKEAKNVIKERGFTINAVFFNGNIEYAKLIDDEELEKTNLEKLEGLFDKFNIVLDGYEGKMNDEILRKIFTYMYH